MSGFKAYQTYLALKSHFNPNNNYDYFKYNKKIKASESSFQKRKDKFFFSRMEKKHGKHLEDYILANIIAVISKGQMTMWFGDFNDKNYIDWLKRKESLKYLFKEEMSTFKEYCERNHIFNLDDMFTVHENHPPFFKQIYGGKISFETAVIADNVISYLKHWSSAFDDPVATGFTKDLIAYRPFINVDVKPYRKVMREILLKTT